MNYFLRTLLLFLLTAVVTIGSLFAQNKEVADKIVAVVNDRIILKSDVDNEIRQYMQQAEMNDQDVGFSEDLWYSALQSIVDNYVMLEQAELDSVVVSDDMVDRAMDQRIQEMIQQAGSEEALERAFGNSIVQIRAEFRDQFRDQMTTQQLQEQKMGSVEITRPEVREFFEEIPENQLPTIPEQVELSQIVVSPPELEDARNEALRLAEALRDSVINHGKDFEEMARQYSDGPSAPRGGLLPMMPLNDLVPNYSAAASALEPGEISQVVRTDFGYHVIRLNERQGDNIETNHILIETDEESVDEDFAINKLETLRDSVINHGESFRELARRHSDDESTAGMGGRILNQQTGEQKLALSDLEPSLYRIALLLDEEGDISDPRPFTMPNSQKQAYRIVRLEGHYPEHVANLDDDYDRIREIALQRKRMRMMSEWLEDLREDIYVDYRIDMPDDVDVEEDMLLPEQETEPVGDR
ncbi:MAG: peptidylprolyl isomerase [Balneolaceae bacterium]